MAQRLATLRERAWGSPSAQALDTAKDYPKPSKGSQ